MTYVFSLMMFVVMLGIALGNAILDQLLPIVEVL